jgi:putative transposase
MDNGTETTSDRFTEWVKEKGISLLFIQLGKLNQNAFGEGFNRSYRDEVFNTNLFN